jgi:hypothetical protein
MQTEPARIIGAVSAFLTLLVAFGVSISDTQNSAILGFLESVLPFLAPVATLVTAEVTRRFVFAPASVQ